MGTDSDSGGGGNRARGWVLKALVLFGGVLLLKRLRKATTRWDHARAVAEALSGEKFSREQARRDPDNYFNIRMLMCPATEMVDGSRVLYFEQAFWRTPQKPFRQVDMDWYAPRCRVVCLGTDDTPWYRMIHLGTKLCRLELQFHTDFLLVQYGTHHTGWYRMLRQTMIYTFIWKRWS